MIYNTQSAQSHRSKMGIIYLQSWKQCALLVITTMALWQLMHLGTWCTSCAQVHELPQSHCGDNREGTLLSWSHIYIIKYFCFVIFRTTAVDKDHSQGFYKISTWYLLVYPRFTDLYKKFPFHFHYNNVKINTSFFV